MNRNPESLQWYGWVKSAGSPCWIQRTKDCVRTAAEIHICEQKATRNSTNRKPQSRFKFSHISDSISGHQIKANITVKWPIQIFWFSNACKSYVYIILLSVNCAIVVYPKNTHTLTKNNLLLKNANYHLSLQWVIIFSMLVPSKVTTTNIIMKLFEILWKLPKCGTETQNEQMLLGKRCP